MEITYHAIKQWMVWEWDQGRNQKVSGNKLKLIHNSSKLMGHSKGSLEKEVDRDTSLLKKDRYISNKQPNPTSTRTGGTTTNSPEVVEGNK